MIQKSVQRFSEEIMLTQKSVRTERRRCELMRTEMSEAF